MLFQGVKEGGITDNASYFVFRQCPDGAFEALPVNEWYNFTPVAKYKRLDADVSGQFVLPHTGRRGKRAFINVGGGARGIMRQLGRGGGLSTATTW